MKLEEVNNFFGDMDLFLMDAILKGHISAQISSVLDVGCGAGRNGIYFMYQGFEYEGWDTSFSQLRLVRSFSKPLPNDRITFQEKDLRSAPTGHFDLVLCSRLLHFAESREDFLLMWNNLTSLVNPNGLLYVCMDSVVNTELAVGMGDGLVEFPDGKHRFALTRELYDKIKKGFDEIEPLKTVIYDGERAQSFILLRKK